MSIIRVQKTEKFTVVSNVHINDDRLSWKATAILTYLLSKPNDWTVYTKQLATAKKDGIKAVYSGIRELKELGYIEHRFIRGDGGKMQGSEYIVHEEPKPIKTPINPGTEPHAQKRHAAKRHAEKGEALIKTDTNKELKDNNNGQAPLPSLINLIPENKRTTAVKKTIERGLNNHSPEYIEKAILYTAKNATGNKTQFKSFLGRCIKEHWHDGCEDEPDAGQIDRQAEQERFKQMPDNALRQLAGVGNELARAEIERRELK